MAHGLTSRFPPEVASMRSFQLLELAEFYGDGGYVYDVLESVETS